MNRWKSFKVSMLFMILVCMLTISGCNSASKGSSVNQGSKSQPVEQAKTTPEAPVVKPAQTKITVTPPAGWDPVPGSTAIAQYLKGGSSFIVTADNIPSGSEKPDAYVDFVKGQFSKSFKDINFEGTKNVAVAGIEGRMLAFTFKVSGMDMKSNVYYVLKGGKAYTFTCGSIVANFDGLKGDFEAFMNSVKFE